MSCKLASVIFEGISSKQITVEAHIAAGIANMSIVGMGNKAVIEAKERIRASFSSLGFSLPAKRITVNLAPADIPKNGSHFDLPIALAILREMDIIPSDIENEYIIIGELGLDGKINQVNGVLPTAILANSKNMGVICPYENGKEACWAGDVNIIAAKNLTDLIAHLKGEKILEKPVIIENEIMHEATHPDIAHVKGQEIAKKALEIAAAGGHHMLMVGQPGIGKSMLASRMPGLLPPLSISEMLEISTIQSVAGLIEKGKLSNQRPFRAPHHSASQVSIIGGGLKASPGEVSLAHCGVLFADELPEFSPHVLDGLRQPIETGEVLIARANYHIKYPARFQLIAAMNPCRCGYGQAASKNCGRGKNCEAQYLARISGPMIDRFDIFLPLSPLSIEDFQENSAKNECSKDIQNKVIKAREIQIQRYDEVKKDNKQADIEKLNVYLEDELLEKFTKLDEKGQNLMTKAATHYKMSARSYNRTIKLARTIADLDQSDIIKSYHLSQAINFRSFV